ncbi:MAG TPA: UDP-N-acetylmuramoyl-L-alanyl-D-glutamate--2,6-diaminopimelate ligase, partial [Bacillota bacterium]|nr:UDP-N-acetylmuramoyl-L-alanyl-D-glutamate--2,6-diaminopimelate ligase [Bacillota bacterium]
FICIKGYHSDAHKYARNAYDAGVRAFIAELMLDLPSDAGILYVADSRLALSRVSACFFDYPGEKMLIIGLTGTKGKTSTSYMIRSILEMNGYRTGIIGTNGIHYNDYNSETDNSTPESYEIQYHLRMMLDGNCNAAIIEATSQAFKLSRVADLTFDISIFTNIGNDHIGEIEHKDFAEYLDCKKQIFKHSKKVIVNRDTEHYEDIIKDVGTPIITYGFSPEADYLGENAEYQTQRHKFITSFYCKHTHALKKYDLNIPGKFSVENALGAVALTTELNIPYDSIRTGLRNAVVYGRMEVLPDTENIFVIIDYAHNEMSMTSLFETVALYEHGKVINVFGAGGNRSKLRRYSMGEVSGRFADLSVITSDNPRYEKLDDIIGDILVGMKKTEGKYVVIKDRREAILYALAQAKENDIVLLCGKGQQDFEEVNGIKTYFNERDVVREFFQSK